MMSRAQITKSLEDNFTDWEAHVFGYGYGTGETHTLRALTEFLRRCPEDGGYDYKDLEAELSPTVAWLLINTLCHADILEYGTSPRFAWLTAKGRQLKGFVTSKTVDQLYDLTSRDENYIHCYPDACNCGPNGHEQGRICQNPFWQEAKLP